MPALSIPAAPDLLDRLGLIFQGLCDRIALLGARQKSLAPMMLLAWSRLRRLNGRLGRLILRFRAGRLPPPKPRPAAASASPVRPSPHLPRRFGWLSERGWEVRGYAALLQHMLDTDAELMALLRAAPIQAGRLLRPTCRMLGVRLPIAVATAPPPRPPAPPRPEALALPRTPAAAAIAAPPATSKPPH